MEHEVATEENPQFFIALAEKIVRAWESMDMDNVRPLYSKEPTLIWFDTAPLKYVGWEAYEKGGADNFAGIIAEHSFEINDDAVVRRSGNLAFCAFTFSSDVTTTEGKREINTRRITEIWERQGDEWLVIHEHLSIPEEMPPFIEKSSQSAGVRAHS